MKLVAILRIKDQISTIDACMSKLSDIADEIFVVDNGSTDGTLEVYKKYPKIKKVLQTAGFDEGRDKVMVHEEAKKSNPDWILWIDADEIFEPHFTRQIAHEYMSSNYNRVTFRMCNFWLNEKDCRCDREYYLYTLHPQRSMWRNVPSAYFKNVKIHNGDILGVPGKTYISPYRIKHYGYVDPEKVAAKMALYKSVDKGGHRDYEGTMSTDVVVRTFQYREFKGRLSNLIYIHLYKFTCNLLWFVYRIMNKLKRLINKSR